MVRVIERLRWSTQRLENITTTPDQHTTATLDDIEKEEQTHLHLEHDTHGDEEKPGEDIVPHHALRRLKIFHSDLTNFGYSDKCPKCNMHKRGQHQKAHRAHHSERCRERIYRLLREEGSSRVAPAESAGRMSTRSSSSTDPPYEPTKNSAVDDNTMLADLVKNEAPNAQGGV